MALVYIQEYYWSNMGNNIYLTGFSATGKTTVGCILANLLEIRIVDIDSMIEEREGTTVPDLFSTQGEDYFRELETICMNDISKLDRVVVATGGGAPVSDKNRAIMKSSGSVIWLKASPKTIHGRLVDSVGEEEIRKGRPVLSAEDPFSRISELLEDREQHYSQADIHVSTENRTPEFVALEIIRRI